MSAVQYDLVVIGGGSGGVRAARFAANAGLNVAIVEGSRWGGTCVNVGCVPKKLYAHASHYHDVIKAAAGFGWRLSAEPHSWSELKSGSDRYIERLNGIYGTLLENAGVTTYSGFASFTSSTSISVGEQEISGTNFLIATGSRPMKPAIPGVDLAVDSNTFFGWADRPQRVVVVGGGYIGVELAGILNGLGTVVTLIHRGEHLLRGFDQDIRTRLTESTNRTGITLELSTEVTRIEQQGVDRVVHLTNGGIVEADEVVFATGRRPNLESLNVDRAGIVLNKRGAVEVDEHYRTNLEHIYAVGDVIDRMQLTPVALAEGMQVVSHLTGESRTPINYDLIPTAVFSEPNVGTVGLSEAAAVAQDFQIQVFESSFRPLHHSLPNNPERVYMKTIVDTQTDRVLGCHMLGEQAGEIIQGLAVALTAGATKAHFDLTLGIHPTMAEEWVTMRTPRAN
jgi:glutathione reductase (NADPH)